MAVVMFYWREGVSGMVFSITSWILLFITKSDSVSHCRGNYIFENRACVCCQSLFALEYVLKRMSRPKAE